ncbi:helicase-exonuclease AddAB subunit AddB [Psychrobacillus lasiicapitis]|uniref:ATP-dependent helicase/deoxyribonuclease subunit B n=1 Tax=Psychrobacillus lasiicapitis TaxID=1636719 RepID=A0A544TE90_9BACI|nr:helicase-exonuclease AddAB subunit AddB [Psychrobacillus lasiicapitis]TQR15764.1 helicase-exonuclease AddAB subunit AddB [Psychrobacillus lasiicapitis]GGA18209.1 ATP-dependent helicase/deoxyribonuclease subunit B [Psychrobacillus lasiicapitis]
MSLRIISGRSGTGKTIFMQQEIVHSLRQDPFGDPLFYIVPDQMSFSSEYDLAAGAGLKGLIRAQVTTFKRLAWRVLQETGGIAKEEISGFGYRMLIRSLLEDHKDEFTLFNRAATKRGFTDQIEVLMKEFSRYCLDHATMANALNQLEAVQAPKTLLDKSADLMLMLDLMEQKLGTSYIDGEGYLTLLAQKIKDSSLLEKTELYIDGFTSFTTRELEIIQALMKQVKRITIALPMETLADSRDEQSLFYQPANTSARLIEIAQAEQVEIEEIVHQAEQKRFVSKELAHIEANFDQLPPAEMKTEGKLRITEAANRRAEIHAVARQIRELMQQKEVRYKEMAILHRDSESYEGLIETIFSQYDIPVFISQKKSMLHHPLIELSRTVLEVIRTGWKYEPMFRAIKTDLFFPLDASKSKWRERADRLENFVLSFGIYGDRWLDDRRWVYKKYRGLEFYSKVQTDEELSMQADLHAARDIVVQPLKKLADTLAQSKTGLEMAAALFTFMESLQVYEKLQVLRKTEEENGQLLLASEHEQAWNEWVNVLDQFVLMFGEKEMSVEEAAKILDEGYDQLEFSRIPPAIDQVIVGNVDIARLTNIKAVFVVGVNDGVFPKRMDHEGLLSDTEREWFTQVGFELAPTSKMRLLDENYLVYKAFVTASEYLSVSYPIADSEGKALLPSMYIKKLQQLIIDVPVEIAVIDPIDHPDDAFDLQSISHPRTTLPYVVMQIRKALETGELPVVWQSVYHYYLEDPYWSTILKRVVKPLIDGNKTERLSQEITSALYGETMISSVSRVERYYSCPFAHYAAYGLKLEERAEYRLEAPAIGDLFHAALKWIADETARLGLTWAQLSKEQCAGLAKQAVDQIVPVFVHQLLLSTNRYRYIQRKLEQIVASTLFALSKHSQVSTFVPIAIEAGFGPGEALPALEIPLKRGRKMQLRGRIDRVDASNVNGNLYVRIVDYKSSRKGIDLNEVYYGLSLQMLTYLDVAIENADIWLQESAEPAGVLYVHMHNPFVKTQKEMSDTELQEEIYKSYKMNGLLLDDPEVIMEMDEQIEGFSKIIPVRMNKDGNLSKSASKVVEPEQMKLLQSFVRKRHEQAGNGMNAGDTRVYPYRIKDKMPCTYCAYRSVCQFDPQDPAQPVRNLKVEQRDIVTEKIRKEMSTDEHS